MHMDALDVKLQMKLRYEFNNNNNISSGDVRKRLPRPAGQTRALCCFISSKGDAMSLITSSSARLKEPISRVSLVGWHGASKRPFGCDQFGFFPLLWRVASLRRTSESTVITEPSLRAAMATRCYGNHVRALISSLVSVRSRAAPAVHRRREWGARAILTAGNRGNEVLMWSAGCGFELRQSRGADLPNRSFSLLL